jgi:hypothetical protein
LGATLGNKGSKLPRFLPPILTLSPRGEGIRKTALVNMERLYLRRGLDAMKKALL